MSFWHFLLACLRANYKLNCWVSGCWVAHYLRTWGSKPPQLFHHLTCVVGENSGGVQLTCPASEMFQGWLAACGWGWRNNVARADSFSRIKSRCSCEPGSRSDFRDLVSVALCHGCSVLMVRIHTQALLVLGIGIEPPVLGRRCATEFMVPYWN